MMWKIEYLKLLDEGPFPNQIDPWAERVEYFFNLQGVICSALLDAIREPLLAMGYQVIEEASIQDSRAYYLDPRIEERGGSTNIKSYIFAATQAKLEIGAAVLYVGYELRRLAIKTIDTGELVTVIEIIFPNHKANDEKIKAYQEARTKLLAQQVHCVEIDLTRSAKLLWNCDVVMEGQKSMREYPYHIAIHLHNEQARFIGIGLNDAPKDFAIPLRGEIVAAPLNKIYRNAYTRPYSHTQLSTAQQILRTNTYTEELLPFPSLLSQDERKDLLAKVEAWKAALAALKEVGK